MVYRRIRWVSVRIISRLVATDPLYRDALFRSLRVAGVSTLVCLVVGFPMALAIARAPPRWQNPLLLAVMLPFWTGS